MKIKIKFPPNQEEHIFDLNVECSTSPNSLYYINEELRPEFPKKYYSYVVRKVQGLIFGYVTINNKKYDIKIATILDDGKRPESFVFGWDVPTDGAMIEPSLHEEIENSSVYTFIDMEEEKMWAEINGETFSFKNSIIKQLESERSDWEHSLFKYINTKEYFNYKYFDNILNH